jgi:hypothetical protein
LISDELAEARVAVTLEYLFEKETDMFPFAVSPEEAIHPNVSKWNLAQIGGEVRDEVGIAGSRIDDAEIRHRRCFGGLGEVSLVRWGSRLEEKAMMVHATGVGQASSGHRRCSFLLLLPSAVRWRPFRGLLQKRFPIVVPN